MGATSQWNPQALTCLLLMARLMTSFVFRQSCMRLSIIPLPTGLLLSFPPTLPISLTTPSPALSLTFLFNYLMSPLLALTPIKMWAAPPALSRLCASDLWSFHCLTVCVSQSVPIFVYNNLYVISVKEYVGLFKLLNCFIDIVLRRWFFILPPF